MTYQINAWLEDGQPQLQILDSQSQSICMSWSYQPSPEEDQNKHEIQRLFRELLLLTCKQQATHDRVITNQACHRLPSQKILTQTTLECS